MARQPRKDLPGLPQHVWIRGNNRLPCFFTDKDRHVYLGYVKEESAERSCDVHAYVLMTNHVHLLVTGRKEGALSRFMQLLNRRYCRYVNQAHERTGTLYEGRFNSSQVLTDHYFLALMRYIELNPVRAAMVPSPGDYRWSSHAQNATGSPAGFLVEHPVYTALGSNRFERSVAYRHLFDVALDEPTLARIRRGIRQNVGTD
jgi:putative transposase